MLENNFEIEVRKEYTVGLTNSGCSIERIRVNGKLIMIVVDQEGIIYFIDGYTGITYKKQQIPCKSEVWSMFIVEQEEDKEIENKRYNLYLGAGSGVLYNYEVRVGITKAEHTEGSTDPNFAEYDFMLSLIWQHKTDDLITQIDYLDINKDGKKEIIIASMDKTLRILDSATGKFIWGQIFTGGVTKFNIGDVDSDGSLELIAGSTDGTLRIFSGTNGALKYFHEFKNTIRIIEVIKGNKDNNKGTEPSIIVGNDEPAIYILKKRGGINGDGKQI
ncbi:MAG: FG-GAP-like repeat-containing protein, partial [Promethearchaeota archaeon]